MILLSAGHRPGKPGEEYIGFNEHDEAVLWVNEIHSYIEDYCVIIPPNTTNNKLKTVYQLIDKNYVGVNLWFEIHFNGVKTKKIGPQIQYNPKHKNTKELANKILKPLELYFGQGEIVPGYYRNDKLKGLDFLLDKTPIPTLLIFPDYFHNIEQIQKIRNGACMTLADIFLRIATYG